MSIRRYKLNENFFSKPNLLNSYWAGFIAADGCVMHPPSGQNILQIQLHIKDEKHLLNLKRKLKYSGPLGYYITKTTPTAQISIRSNKLCSDLLKNFNITVRKTLTLKPPKKLTKNQALAFIVGYIDGDGYITGITHRETKYRSFHLNVLSTKNMLDWIVKILSIKEGKTKIFYSVNKVTRLVLNGRKNHELFKPLEKLPVPKLQRKWKFVRKMTKYYAKREKK